MAGNFLQNNNDKDCYQINQKIPDDEKIAKVIVTFVNSTSNNADLISLTSRDKR